ncbi:hypothetical protein [Brachybacterium huguangmaarense]
MTSTLSSRPLESRAARLASLTAPVWITDPAHERAATDWLKANMDDGPLSDGAVSVSWCIRRVRSWTQAMAFPGRTIAYSDPTGEHASNRATYGGGRR